MRKNIDGAQEPVVVHFSHILACRAVVAAQSVGERGGVAGRSAGALTTDDCPHTLCHAMRCLVSHAHTM